MEATVGGADDMSSDKQGERSVRAVEIEAELRQIKTMADGSVNVVLNLPEYCIPQVKIILDWLGEQVRVLVEK